MDKKAFFMAGAGLILLAFLMSCTLSGPSEVEFAKDLMKESADTTADTTGLYDKPVIGKTGTPTGDALTIDIHLPPGNPPETGPYIVTLTFDDYIPACAPNSIVRGVLVATVTLDLDGEPPTVTIVFDGDLIVFGEHSGDYYYDAVLIIDLSTGEYTYSGDIVIDDKVYKTD
jgi:hypothetical protein